MEHFVTLFDSLFLPQGLALHRSMERHVQDYTLWILCVDDEAHAILTAMNLYNVRLLQLSRLETEELRRIKPTRSNGEYCWTLTPFAPRFVFEADHEINRVTYIDADIWFCKSPKPIFQDFISSGKNVLITDHGYAPEYDQSTISGQYCVQFVIFNRDGGGEIVRKWWEDRCVEWCFSRFEEGKFGDQKYLDDWPEIFSNDVHVLSNKELTLAPWNATRFPIGCAVFFHFHAFKIVSKNSAVVGNYYLPKPVRLYLYKPYLKEIHLNIINLCEIGWIFRKQANSYGIFYKIKKCIRLLNKLIKKFLYTGNIKLD